MNSKTISQSLSKQDHIIMPFDVNSDYTLFGGKLMQWIDIVAAVVARRHSGCLVRTAAVDHLDFLSPAALGDIVTIEGRIIHAGRTSMIILTETYVEHPQSAEKVLTNVAYLTMVAVDEKGAPTPIPALRAESAEDEKYLALGEARRKMRGHQ